MLSCSCFGCISDMVKKLYGFEEVGFDKSTPLHRTHGAYKTSAKNIELIVVNALHMASFLVQISS